MRFAICEDHRDEAVWLQEIIEAWADRERQQIEIRIFEDTASFQFAREDGLWDALFLDIQMPGENGIDLARKLRKQGDEIPIVFVTGLESHMSEGYEVDAVHYLLKPVQSDKVWGCLDRIRLRMKQRVEEEIVLETEDSMARLKVRDILKIEVYSRKCIYTTEREEYIVTEAMKEAVEKVPRETFILCHRGILVNVFHIQRIEKDKLHLTGGMTVPVSRRLYPTVNQAFINFYRGGLR